MPLQFTNMANPSIGVNYILLVGKTTADISFVHMDEAIKNSINQNACIWKKCSLAAFNVFGEESQSLPPFGALVRGNLLVLGKHVPCNSI